MIPIFLSAAEFNGEVQFVITETRPWWMHKYVPVFQKLSRYEIIDFDNDEADVNTNVARFAKVINSCDVLMGVHGAGLTNLVFLPLNATMIQIVPWGGLEGIAMFDFGNGAKAMKLNYVQYSISVKESTLTELYPRDHPVFKNPIKFHKRGWDLLKDTFMVKQNVKLDANRFRKVLWKALEHMML